MKHEEIKILLHDHINGKLNDHLTTQIEDHLSECNECSQKLNSLKALMKKVDELTRKRKPPEDFWQDIFISISAEKSENLKIKEELDLKEAQVYLAEDKEERDKRNGRIKGEKNLIRKHEKATPRSKKKKSIFI